MENVKKEENKIKISDEEIEKFIRLNDKRKETVLINYKHLIIRLLGTGISKKKIYEFIFDNDKEIGTQINFYKYIERNIENKTKSKKEIEKKETITEIANKPTINALKPTETKKEETILPNINQSATSKLSEDMDLLDGVEWVSK